jgi:hypothetical protein
MAKVLQNCRATDDDDDDDEYLNRISCISGSILYRFQVFTARLSVFVNCCHIVADCEVTIIILKCTPASIHAPCVSMVLPGHSFNSK